MYKCSDKSTFIYGRLCIFPCHFNKMAWPLETDNKNVCGIWKRALDILFCLGNEVVNMIFYSFLFRNTSFSLVFDNLFLLLFLPGPILYPLLTFLNLQTFLSFPIYLLKTIKTLYKLYYPRYQNLTQNQN